MKRKSMLSFIIGFALAGLLFTATPINAAVGDNLDTVYSKLLVWLGYNKESNTPTEEEFDTASLVEKVNYLEEQLDAVFQYASDGKKSLASNMGMSDEAPTFEALNTQLAVVKQQQYDAGKAAGRNTIVNTIGTKCYSVSVTGGQEYSCSRVTGSSNSNRYAGIIIDIFPVKDMDDDFGQYTILKMYKNETLLESATKSGYMAFNPYGAPIRCWKVTGTLLNKDTGEKKTDIVPIDYHFGSSYNTLTGFGCTIGTYWSDTDEAYVKASQKWVFIPDYDYEFWILGLK